jgi:hypothetical protein
MFIFMNGYLPFISVNHMLLSVIIKQYRVTGVTVFSFNNVCVLSM